MSRQRTQEEIEKRNQEFSRIIEEAILNLEQVIQHSNRVKRAEKFNEVVDNKIRKVSR